MEQILPQSPCMEAAADPWGPGFWPPGVEVNECLLSEAAQLTVFGYSHPGKPMQALRLWLIYWLIFVPSAIRSSSVSH